MEDLKEALSRRVGTEVAVEENEVQKLQQESYEGIVIRKENESIGVNVDATRLYSDLEQSRAYEDVLHYAVDIAQKGFEDAPKIDISQIMNYEVMKHSLITRMARFTGVFEKLGILLRYTINALAYAEMKRKPFLPMYNPIIFLKRQYDVQKEDIRKIWILHHKPGKWFPVEIV